MLTLILAVVLVLILLLVWTSQSSLHSESLTPHDPLALCKIGVQNKQCCWGMFVLPAGPHKKDPGQIACPSSLVEKTDPAVYIQQGVDASNPQWCVCAGTLGPKSSPYPQCEPNSAANKQICAWFQE